MFPKNHRCPPPPALLLSGILIAGFGLLSGCTDAPLGPEPGAPSVASHSENKEWTTDPEPKVWNLVASQWVHPGEETEVSASRYTLRFSKGSLEEKTLITIREHDQDQVDVEFGPDGIKFLEPVVLEIDFKDTSSDPAANSYHGKPAAVFYFNPLKNLWEEIPSSLDKSGRKLTVKLEHFSRYSMYDPTKEGEWQWRAELPIGDDLKAKTVHDHQ